jgi:hypothetical protein
MIAALREWRVGNRAADDAHAFHGHWWLDLRTVVPLFAGLAYLVALVARVSGTLSSFYWYGDFPEALRLGDAVFHGGYGQGLSVPSQTGIGPLWAVGLLDQVTRSDMVGMTFGALMVALAIALMVRTAYQVIGRTGAVAVAVLSVAAPPVVAWEMLTPIAHESTLLLCAIGAWQLVSLSRAARGHAVTFAVLAGALAGVCVVSDSLAIAGAVVPWIICAVLLWRRDASRRLPLAVTACAGILSAAVVDVLSRVSGIVEQGNIGVALSTNGVSSGLRTVATTLGQMISGAWYSNVVPGILVILGLVSFLAVIYMAIRVVRSHAVEHAQGRDLYVWFWLLSCAGLIAGFCLSGLGRQYNPVDYQGHYVDGLWFAAAALLPLGLVSTGTRRRALLVACVAALAVVSTVGIATTPAELFNGPDYVDAGQLTATLRQLGVVRGYGGYWESYAVGWHTGDSITALPLQQCASGLCHYEFAAPAWYRPQPGPVFVIAEASPCTNDSLCIDSASLAGLPAPESVRAVGLLRVYVYARDVFASLPAATGT